MSNNRVILTRTTVQNPGLVWSVPTLQRQANTLTEEIKCAVKGSALRQQLTESRKLIVKKIREIERDQKKQEQMFTPEQVQELREWFALYPTLAEIRQANYENDRIERALKAVNAMAEKQALEYIEELDKDIQEWVLDGWMDMQATLAEYAR